MVSSKEILKIFKTQRPLELSLVRFKKRFTLGESILMFYGVHPIKSFSNLLQTYVYETLSCGKDMSIIIDDPWLEKVFNEEAQIYRRLIPHVEKDRTFAFLDLW